MRLGSLKAVAALAVVLAGLSMAATPLVAQSTGTIRGQVVESSTQRPMAGVQVAIPDTRQGALTNQQGNYLIMNVPVGSHPVSVQIIGYATVEATVEVQAGQATDLNFTLSQSAIQLDGLVVTGTPGATQKRALGNTVSTIAAEELTDVTPITTVSQMLEGRTPGLTVMAASGQVGTAPNIRIRGASSLNAGIQPVFYVDGVRVNSSSQGGYGTSNNTVRETSALDNLNPQDIESIEVIKGPAAATLYGADAAAGVIQIITKKGRAGQQDVEWAGRVEYGQSDWALDMKTNYTLCTDARINDSRHRWPGCEGMDPNADWQSRLLTGQPLRDDNVLRNGAVTNYHLSARGGGDRYSFYLAGDKGSEEGVFPNNYFNRTNGRANFTILPYESLTLQFSTQYSQSESQQPNNDNSSNGWLRNAYRGLPGNDAPWAPGWRGLGPEQIAMYDNSIKNERWILGATADYKPFDWFRHHLTVGMDAGQRINTLFYPIDRTGRAPFGASNANGYIAQYMPATRDYTVDYSGTIDTGLPFGEDITSSLSFGMQYLTQYFHSPEIVGEGLVADPVRLVSNAATTRAYEGRTEQKSLGFFAQEQIGWKNRRFITAGLRVDDHSAFGRNFSLIYYPKVAGSWVISEEPFFNFDFINNLRLRASYGQAGNAPAPFTADRTYGASSVILEDGSIASALIPDSYGNPDLKAERGEEYEAGFDASFLNDAVGVEVTYYNNTTKDALITVPVAPSTGFTGSRWENIGEIHNTGLELSVFGTPIRKPTFSWDVRVGLSTNHNELVSLGGSRDFIPVGYRSVQRHQEGFPLAGYWAEQILYNADGTVMRDAGGDIMLSDTMDYVGPSVPTREASLTNTFTVFHNLSLYTFMDYKGGHYLFNMGGQTAVWDGNAKIANDPTVTDDEWDVAYDGGNRPYLEKADYVKLREVSLRYSLPTRWASLFRTNSMSFTLAGRNLALWTKYSGSDPEVNIGGSSNSTRADYMSVPMMRQFSASIDFRF